MLPNGDTVALITTPAALDYPPSSTKTLLWNRHGGESAVYLIDDSHGGYARNQLRAKQDGSVVWLVVWHEIDSTPFVCGILDTSTSNFYGEAAINHAALWPESAERIRPQLLRLMAEATLTNGVLVPETAKK